MSDQQTPPSASIISETKASKMLEKFLMASIVEHRRARRWGIFFKVIIISISLLFFLGLLLQTINRGDLIGEHTAVINVTGVIAQGRDASADNIVASLRSAFESKNSQGIVLRINSPGGSAVQSGYIYDEIKRLREKYPNTKVYAVITDIGASGAYYIAAAADEIYADKASLIGSIGVVMSSFGFVDTLEKLGIERRLMVAGEHKGFLDPFSPVVEKEQKLIQGVLDTIHQQFITSVKQGRGDRLSDTPDIFSGLIWSGEQAKQLGLIDALGSTSYVAREVIGHKTMVDYTVHRNVFQQLVRGFGASMADSLADRVLVSETAKMP